MMGQWAWDWSSYSIGESLDAADWSYRGNLPSSHTFTVESDANGQAGRCATLEGQGATATDQFFIPDTLSALEASSGEVYIEFRALTDDNQYEYEAGASCFVKGGLNEQAADLDGYSGFSESATNGPRPAIYQTQGGSWVRIARMSLQPDIELSKPWSQRFQWEDAGGSVTLRWRRWRRDEDSEPATWDLEITNTGLTGAPGAVGLRPSIGAAIRTYLFVGIGTDGDPAPTTAGGGGGATSASVTEGATAGESCSAAASLALGVTEGAVAGDTATAVAAAVSALHEAAVSGDTDQTTLSALGDIAAAASSSDTHAAAAHVALTIAEGAGAGDAWVAEAQAVADLIAGGAAGEQIIAGTDALTSKAIREPGEAGAAFLAAVQAYAGVTGAATSADAFTGAVAAIGRITESGIAGDAFSASVFEAAVRSLSGHAIASDTIDTEITARARVTEGAVAGSVFEAIITALARVSEPALAGDTYDAASTGIGYLVVRAAAITAALAGEPGVEDPLEQSGTSIGPNLSGSPDVKPEK